jgi:hypothetical protein
MKFCRLIFSLCILGCIAITSCKTSISAAGKLSLIPGNATMVLEINGSEILTKSGLDSPDNYSFLNLLMVMDSEVSEFLESLLKGSKDAGISAEKILVYASKLPNFAVHIPMVDKTAFENWLKKAESPQPVNEDDFRYISIYDDLNMAWNNNVVIISNASSREQIARQFKAKDDGLLATCKDFEEFTAKDADIRMWMRYDFLIDFYKNLLFFSNYSVGNEKSEQLFSDMKDFANLSSHFYLNFEDGKITGNTSFYPAEEIENLKKKFPIFKKNFNADLAKDTPEQSYLALNTFIDVKEYVKIIRQNIEKALSHGAIDKFDIAAKSAELFEFFDSPELKSVIEALGGDVLVSIHGFNNGIIPYPLASAGFTVNGEEAFNNILNLIPENIYSKHDGYYSIAALNKTFASTFIPVYFAYKDNRVIVSNDLTAIQVFAKGQREKTFADNPISKLMTDKMMFYINLDFETYPDNVKLLLQNFMGREYKLFSSIIEIYECIYFTSDTNYNMEFSLQLKNKNVNSLKQILTNIDKTSSSAWMNLK